MVISKEKMRIELEENIEKLESEIKELEKIKNILINSSTYKLLYGKTTVREKGKEEEQQRLRARLEHSENIVQPARDLISRIYDECATEEQKKTQVFTLNKERELLYTEIGSLAHDLGHTPFGHEGEKSISEFMEGVNNKEEINRIIQKRIQVFGSEYEEAQGHMGEEVALSFEHNEQSALLFYNLMHSGEIDLNKVDENKLLQIILCHSRKRVRECPEDLVAQVVRHMDTIESRIMDFCELSKYIRLERFKNKEYAQKSAEQKMEEIIEDLVEESIKKGKIDDNMEAEEELTQFREDYKEAIYFLHDGRKGLLTSENIERNRVIILKLLKYYYENPDKINTKYYSKVTPINPEEKEKIHSVYDSLKYAGDTRAERAVNFIVSMDNESAKRKYLELVKQRIVTGEGIEPVTPEEIQIIIEAQEHERINQWKGGKSQGHTKQEIRNMIRSKDAKFARELTPEGIECIEWMKRKEEEEAKLDRLLYEEMEKADLARKYKRKTADAETIDSMLGKKPKMLPEEKARKIAMQVKEEWQNAQGKRNNDEHEGR